MNRRNSSSDHDRDRRWRDLLLPLLLLPLMFGCLLAAAQIAITPTRAWQVPANMLSELNPDKGYDAQWGLIVEPLRPEVMTPPAWNLNTLLTPIGRGVVVSPLVFFPVPTGTATPQEIAQAPTHAPSATPGLPTLTPLPTIKPTGTQPPILVTAMPTWTPLPTSTPVPTTAPTDKPPHEPHPTATLTHTPVPPTPTDTPAPTATTDPPPAAPTGLRAAAGDQQIILGWDPNSEPDLTGYRLYSSTADVDSFSDSFIPVTTTSYLNLSLVNGTTYHYYVTAIDAANNESGPSNIAKAQPYDITPYTYPPTPACSGVPDCNNAGESPDGNAANISGSGVLTFDLGSGHGIIDGSGYDMVFYEWPYGSGIQLDYIVIELSADGANWYTVFEWDGVPGGVAGTNIDSFAADYDGEKENEPIPSSALYGQPPYQTGIAIDIGAWTPPGYSYHLVRLTYPTGGTDAGQVDTIQRLH